MLVYVLIVLAALTFLGLLSMGFTLGRWDEQELPMVSLISTFVQTAAIVVALVFVCLML